MFSYFVLIGILAGSFFLVQQIMEYQEKIKTDSIVIVYDLQATLQLSSLILSLILNGINIILKHICIMLTK